MYPPKHIISHTCRWRSFPASSGRRRLRPRGDAGGGEGGRGGRRPPRERRIVRRGYYPRQGRGCRTRRHPPFSGGGRQTVPPPAAGRMPADSARVDPGLPRWGLPAPRRPGDGVRGRGGTGEGVGGESPFPRSILARAGGGSGDWRRMRRRPRARPAADRDPDRARRGLRRVWVRRSPRGSPRGRAAAVRRGADAAHPHGHVGRRADDGVRVRG